jgi:branched-subunit amino acid ABC-type transport system permease component
VRDGHDAAASRAISRDTLSIQSPRTWAKLKPGEPGKGTEAVDARFWLIQAFNGISYGALLFLVGSGLSLIFGVMRIVNLSHGSYFLLGGYIALSVIWTTGSWLLAIPVAAVTVALIGLVMERVFLRPLGFDPLRQVLLTVGFTARIKAIGA